MNYTKSEQVCHKMKNNLKKKEQISAALIEEAFLKLMEKRDFGSIPISLICREATVSRNTFYRLFNSKEDLLEYILGKQIKLIITQYEQAEGSRSLNTFTPKDIYNIYYRYFSCWYSNKQLLKLLKKQNMFSFLYKIHPVYFTNTGTDFYISKSSSTMKYADYYYLYQSASLVAVLDIWTVHDFKESLEEISKLCLKMFSSLNAIPKI